MEAERESRVAPGQHWPQSLIQSPFNQPSKRVDYATHTQSFYRENFRGHGQGDRGHQDSYGHSEFSKVKKSSFLEDGTLGNTVAEGHSQNSGKSNSLSNSTSASQKDSLNLLSPDKTEALTKIKEAKSGGKLD